MLAALTASTALRGYQFFRRPDGITVCSFLMTSRWFIQGSMVAVFSVFAVSKLYSAKLEYEAKLKEEEKIKKNGKQLSLSGIDSKIMKPKDSFHTD